MNQIEEDDLRRFKSLVGLEDVNGLFDAGIRTIWDYAKADPGVLEKLTGQRKNELLERRIAGKIYLRSGLEPEICLRLVSAGAHNSCETLSLESENLELNEWEDRCFQMAKLNIAYENIRGFLASGKTGDKEAILAQIEKKTPKEKEAAVKSVEIICTLRQFRWLRAEFESKGGEAIDPENLAKIVAEIPEDDVRAIIENLDKQYADVLPQKEQTKGLGAGKRKGGGTAGVGEAGGAVGDSGLLNTIIIEGIGPKYSAILADTGISIVEDLRIMNAAGVNARTHISLKRLRKWQGAAILLQIPGVDVQVAEAFTAAGYLDIRSIAYAQPMNLYHAIERARTPRDAKNMIPDDYQRVITPNTVQQIYKAAYDMYFPAVPPTTRQALSIAPYGEWIRADEANYGPVTGTRYIRYIVIHAMAGSMWGTIDEFSRPNDRKASAHYLVGRNNGRVVQMVDDNDAAFHAANNGVDCRGFSAPGCSGNRTTGTWDTGPCNCTSIGIELEDLGGYTWDSTWITDAMYRETANLVSYLCDRYGIQKRFVGNSFESSGILGHEHVVGKTVGKNDPGPFFNWDHFIKLVDPQQSFFEPQHEDEGKGGGGK